MSQFNEKLSLLIGQQVPDFVRDNHETFVAFLKAYYEYLEQDEQAQRVLQTARDYSDVDRTLDSFVDYFLQEFAYGIPEYIFEIDKTEAQRFFVKYVSSLYKSKGSPNALKFLFRLAFDEEIDVIYPYDFLLRPSDGKFGRSAIVKARFDDTVDPSELVNKTLFSEQTELLTSVDSVVSENGNIYELFLEEKDFFSNDFHFVAGERLISGGNVTGNIRVLTTLTDVSVHDGGLGYKVTDPIISSSPDVSATITKVDETGKIIKADVVVTGANVDPNLTLTVGLGSDTRTGHYELVSNVATIVLDNNVKHGLVQGDVVNVTVSSGTLESNTYVVSDILTKKAFRINYEGANTTGNISLTYQRQANIAPVIGTVIRRGGGYGINLDGQLDTIILIQDSLKWQQYSYVIKSSLNVDKWLDLVKSVLHPAGLAIFGEVSVFTEVGETDAVYVGPVSGSTAFDAFIQFILEIISESAGDARMQQPDSFYTLELEYSSQYIDSSVSRYSAGATLETIDRHKFEYGNAFPINIITQNNIFDARELTIEDFVLTKNQKSSFQPPSFVDFLNRVSANANVIYNMYINT